MHKDKLFCSRAMQITHRNVYLTFYSSPINIFNEIKVLDHCINLLIQAKYLITDVQVGPGWVNMCLTSPPPS